MDKTVKTDRLLLRPWKKEDLEPFALLNADPRVREYFPGLLTREQSDASVKLISDHIDRFGWGFWAASLLQTGEFIGFIGLEDVPFTTHFTPAVEIGWRLAFDHWGKGYAMEGALAALQYGFERLNLKEIISFTAVQNKRSRQVMEKIGMHHHSQDDFNHPKLSEEHPLSMHVLYRIKATEWKVKDGKTNLRTDQYLKEQAENFCVHCNQYRWLHCTQRWQSRLVGSCGWFRRRLRVSNTS